MLGVGSRTADGGLVATALRRIVRVILWMALLVAVLVAGGFLWYVGRLPVPEVPFSRKADGIVVLTGGAFRINEALDLLSSGYGKRLLISGVHPNTRSAEISRLNPEHRRWFSCCVDLDYSALNTVGNAIETRRWVRDRNFKSLIVVTSDFHMPRAMAELEHQIPDVVLVPYPVISERVRVDAWWTSPSSARLLFSEYLKYIVVLIRLRLELAID
jgi:uncharacterized SAM-binding protein YcdF (DUF218 family)